MTPLPTIDWEFVLGTIESGKCVLFIGPEAATTADDIPLQQALTSFLEPDDNPNILSYYKEDGLFLFQDAISKTKVYYKIKKFYKDHEVPQRYLKLAQIPFHLVITVNPDDLMNRAFEESGIDLRHDFYRKRHNPKEFDEPIKPSNPVLYNLFGNVEDEESLVLTHDDMFDFLLSILGDNQLPNEMRSALQTADDYIFLGFDFGKWYVQMLLRLLNLHNDKYKFARYASNKKMTEETKRFCREQFKIEFSDFDMDKFIDELHSRSKEAGILRKLGEKISKTSEAVAMSLKRGDIDESMAIMEAFFKEKDEEELMDELTGVQSRYNRTKTKVGKGVIDEKEAELAFNKITESLIELNNEVKDLE